MYDRIGKKIMSLSQLVFWMEAIVSVIVGIILLLSSQTVVFGIVIIFFGPLLAWIGSWILYAFGQIADDLHQLAGKQNPLNTQGFSDEALGGLPDMASPAEVSHSASHTLRTRSLSREVFYNEALSLMDQGRYDEAAYAFDQAGSYKDSVEKWCEARYKQGLEYLEHDPEKAAEYFFNLRSYRDVQKIINDNPELKAAIRKLDKPKLDMSYSE